MRGCLLINLICLVTVTSQAAAGIDKFTALDRIKGWEIERRIDSETQNIRCRASIPNHYAWFGGKIRLSRSGALIVPDEFSNKTLPDEKVINRIKEALQECESGLIYKINIDDGN